jgi:predicted AAA+ superfamily ATPase
MQRDLYDQLVQWKSSPHRKPLVLRGARQVGKTYLLQHFGQRQYEAVAYFNFEQNPDLDDFFSGPLDPVRIIRNLSLYQGWTIEPERHLILFDEIQASNTALNSLKYFNEEANQYHIATAGSLLGIKLSRPSTFPVGKVNFLDLYPLTFQEFLSAVGRQPWRTMITERTDFTPFPTPFHTQLVDLLRSYYYVGGMPEAVNRFIDDDLASVRQVHGEILDAYALDFAKHAQAADIAKLSLIWDSIPTQLARENKKFMFSALRKSARAREYENALQWLTDAGLVLKSYAVTTAQRPLKGYMNRDAFKVFLLDVGLLAAMARIPAEVLVRGDALFNEYQGAFVENYVAQQLHADQRLGLYYWKSQGQRAEVDFLWEQDEVYPLEAKAGINPRSKSLRSYDEQFNPPTLSRTTLLNLKHDGKICNYPLYALTLFPQLSGLSN